jgi:hypothetical protein
MRGAHPIMIMALKIGDRNQKAIKRLEKLKIYMKIKEKRSVQRSSAHCSPTNEIQRCGCKSTNNSKRVKSTNKDNCHFPKEEFLSFKSGFWSVKVGEESIWTCDLCNFYGIGNNQMQIEESDI